MKKKREKKGWKKPGFLYTSIISRSHSHNTFELDWFSMKQDEEQQKVITVTNENRYTDDGVITDLKTEE